MTFWAFVVAGLAMIYFIVHFGAASIVIKVGVRREERRARAAEDDFVAWADEFDPTGTQPGP